MQTIQVTKSDFRRILTTAEVLIDEVEQALSQDDVVKERIRDIKSGRIKGKTEDDYYEYFKQRLKAT